MCVERVVPADLTELRETVRTLRERAQDRMRADRRCLFPHVKDHDFDAVVNAVGEISIVEARDALARLERAAHV